MKKHYGVGEYSVDANDAWAVLESRLYKRDGSTTGVIQAHGHSTLPHTALALLYDSLFLGDIPHHVANVDYPVIGGDFEDNAWGNDGALITMRAAYNWLTGDQFNAKAGEIWLMGGSMGMVTICNFANWVQGGYVGGFGDPPDVEIKGIVGVIPVTDLDSVHDRNYAGYASEIETAYGGLSAYNAALPTHNPIAYAADIANIPQLLMYSLDDPATLPADVEAYGAIVGAQMAPIGGGVGHSYYGADLDTILTFMDEHA